MAKSNKNTHLSLEERNIIQTGVSNGSSKKAIALTLGKDNSTIGKEIKAHRKLTHKCSYPTDCQLFKKCQHNRQCTGCIDYNPFKCSRRDRSPGVCNGCPKYIHCRYDKYIYKADLAHKEYREQLVDSRVGINLTYNELKEKAEIIVPLIKAGQSPYHIVTNHPELNMSEKTLYNYIEDGVFRQFDLIDIDLRMKVRRKMKKPDKVNYKKRQDRKYLKGREYKDFKAYTKEHPELSIVEMDTVYNDVSNGPFMQTFKFMIYSFLLIIYHDTKTADDMVQGIDLLEKILGKELFAKEVAIILTDRGSEFSAAERIEKEENGSRRTRIFYCDPMQSGQKGSLENNHIEIRYICPKETDLKSLGFTDQDKANLVVSHINSTSKQELRDKSPIELMKFLNPEMFKKLQAFGIEEIEKDKIILKPYLLK